MTNQLLPMHQDERSPAERMPSLIFGVTSVTIGFGTLILLVSQTESRRDHRAWIAAAGLIVCSIAFVLVLILMARAAPW